MSLQESIQRFVDTIGSTVNSTFLSIELFIDGIKTFFVDLSFWILILFFFLLVIVMLSSPFWIFNYMIKLKDQFNKIKTKLINSF